MNAFLVFLYRFHGRILIHQPFSTIAGTVDFLIRKMRNCSEQIHDTSGESDDGLYEDDVDHVRNGLKKTPEGAALAEHGFSLTFF